MRKIFLFMMVSADGFFEGPDHDLSWHNVDDEFNEFAHGQNRRADTILMGHRTYDLMASVWPKEGMKIDPETARFMNETPKLIVSHEPFTPEWGPTTVVTKNLSEEIRKAKAKPGRDIEPSSGAICCVSVS